MTLREYQSAAMAFSPEGHDRIHYGCLGLIGECGEIVDAVKKQRFNPRRDTGSDALKEELGDVMWYLAELASGLGIDLAEEIEKKKFQPTDHRIDSTERYAVKMAGLSHKCYDYGYLRRKNDTMLNGMRKIYACARMIAQINGIAMREIFDFNIRKLKRRYPQGCG